jgi:hypothetical protein
VYFPNLDDMTRQAILLELAESIRPPAEPLE